MIEHVPVYIEDHDGFRVEVQLSMNGYALKIRCPKKPNEKYTPEEARNFANAIERALGCIKDLES